MLLWGAAIDTQAATQTWLTYKQAQKLGGQVRKGETGTTICYADSFIPKAEKERAAETGGEASRIGFLKRYTVFNADQCEGLSDEFYEGVEPLPEAQSLPIAEKLIAATGANFNIGGDKAFYSSHHDCIQVPPQPAFFEHINYYRTCFHELGQKTSASTMSLRAINSDLPGQVIGQVTENVFDTVTGQHLLIPQGSRLMGRYDSVIAFGQSRALVVWTRLILPNGDSIQLDNLPGSDAQGFAGLRDNVDRHTWQFIKGAALSSLLSVGSELASDDKDRLTRALQNAGQDSAKPTLKLSKIVTHKPVKVPVSLNNQNCITI